MPRYVSPTSPMPEKVARLTAILGIPQLRAEIIRYLSQHPDGGTSGEIAGALGTRYQTVQRHLEQLEDLDAVRASVSPPRRGHHVVFKIVPSALAEAIDENTAYMQGS